MQPLDESIDETADPTRNNNRLILFFLWIAFYGSFTLLTPPLLDDADSVHAEVAREMLLRHDYVTLYANGIRYLEKAPLLYWSMAASFKIFGTHTAAARLPLAFTVLALALALESFARRAFASIRAGLYAALILLSSFGIFIFTRITIPDAMVCLWLTLALYAYYLTERSSHQSGCPISRPSDIGSSNHKSSGAPSLAASSPKVGDDKPSRLLTYTFAAACALNILTKGLIGIVFPVTIVLLHLLLTRGPRGTIQRLRQLHPLTSTLAFFAIAAPWHILIALANPAQGNPGHLAFIHHHWSVPQPTQGNVHGWAWFYFVNEHLLRYLNLRVPRDYDTVPLYLFWGLLLIWLMPWSAFLPHALARIPAWKVLLRSPLTPRESTLLLLGLWAAIPMLFFSLSTRQEYYVLPIIPALVLLLAAWLNEEVAEAETFTVPNPRVTAGQRISVLLFTLGSIAALAAAFLAFHSTTPGPSTDLASLLHQNPSDYALSFGHFLDLNAQAMGAFHDPLLLTAIALFTGTLANWFLRRTYKPHAANLWLAAATFSFLIAAHLSLQIFAPVLSSKHLADTIALSPPDSKFPDLIVINGEFESASTLAFYLHRPIADEAPSPQPQNPNTLDNNSAALDKKCHPSRSGGPASRLTCLILELATPDTSPNRLAEPIHILNGRSSNLWYGSFFPDAPAIFEDNLSLSLKWSSPRRIFLWQDLSQPLPPLLGKTYFITQSGGKEILSNQPNPF